MITRNAFEPKTTGVVDLTSALHFFHNKYGASQIQIFSDDNGSHVILVLVGAREQAHYDISKQQRRDK